MIYFTHPFLRVLINRRMFLCQLIVFGSITPLNELDVQSVNQLQFPNLLFLLSLAFDDQNFKRRISITEIQKSYITP